MLLVEVLSAGTEAYDRGDTWDGYQRLPSLMDYVLVSQREVRVEHYQRRANSQWLYRAFGPGEEVVLTTGTTLSVDALYTRAFDLPGD